MSFWRKTDESVSVSQTILLGDLCGVVIEEEEEAEEAEEEKAEALIVTRARLQRLTVKAKVRISRRRKWVAPAIGINGTGNGSSSSSSISSWEHSCEHFRQLVAAGQQADFALEVGGVRYPVHRAIVSDRIKVGEDRRERCSFLIFCSSNLINFTSYLYFLFTRVWAM